MSNRARDDKAGIVMLGVTSTGAKIPVLVDDTGVLSDSPATGGATSAKQDTQITAEQAILAKLPTVGTAGTASANVLSVQGIASGTALSVSDLRTVTPHFKTLGASGSQVIPIGARGYMATFMTGTGTIGGEVATAGLSVSSSNTLAATVTVATDSASSAFVSWET